MKYTKITIQTAETTEDGVELLTSRLTDLGAEGFEIGGGSDLREIVDSADPDLLDADVKEAVTRNLGVGVTVTVYIPENGQGKETVALIEEFLRAERLGFALGEVREEDWENNWKQYFKPIPVGERLLVKPTWEEYSDGGDRIVLEIDPSGAFGTGQHATTLLCLELLEKYVGLANTPPRVADIGCGSGILSAAAALLGAKEVSAVDICETAIRVTEETFRLNKIGGYRVFCGNIITDEGLRGEIGTGFDIAVANITADVIISMADLLPLFTANTLILSGIIAPRLQEVLTAIEPRFTVVETRESEGWNGLVCVRGKIHSCRNCMNIFDLPNLPIAQELITTLAESDDVRVERIVSTGQVSGWYDQSETELVMLLQGTAEIEFGGGEILKMAKGDTVIIEPHRRHRVCFTSSEPPCIWVCVFY